MIGRADSGEVYMKSADKADSVGKAVFAAAAAVVVYRIFNAIPTPGVNTQYFKSLMESNQSLGFLNSMTGGGFEQLSVMALGITPYITATIIIQLLGILFPALNEMQRGGAAERKKIDIAGIILGEAVAFLQAFVMGKTFGKSGMLIDSSLKWVIFTAVIWSLGTLVLTLMGRHIQKVYKINGISVILLAGIIASWPHDAYYLYGKLTEGRSSLESSLYIAGAGFLVLVLFLFTVRAFKAEKKIPIIFSRARSCGDEAGVLPLKLCPGSVVPVVFASSLIALPALITKMTGKGEDSLAVSIFNSSNWLSGAHPIYSIGAVIYIGLIFFFSFYYSNVVNNPVEIANNLRKTGAAIPGVRAGEETADYIVRENRSVLALGALSLTAIAFLPIVLADLFGLPRISFLGTSVIITVGVMIDLKDTITGKKIMNAYTSRKELF